MTGPMSLSGISEQLRCDRWKPGVNRLRVPGRHDTGIFHHENDGAFRRPRTMKHTLRNNKALPRVKFDRPSLQVDQKAAFENEEEFIVVVVFVPVIFALHHAKSNHRIVHLAKRLVVPAVVAGRDQVRNVDQRQSRITNIEISCIGVALRLCHDAFHPSLKKILTGLIDISDLLTKARNAIASGLLHGRIFFRH
jgi:hypothetical protein